MSRAEKKQADRAGAEDAPARGRGRPRSAEADRAITEATLKRLAVDGIGGLSIEGVAEEAGVGKTTIYRRWPTKADLIEAAVAQLAPPGAPPETGSLHGDLQAFADAQRARVAGTPLLVAAPRVLSEAVDYPDIHAGFMRAVIEPVRGAIRTIVERGIARGEVPEDADIEGIVDVLHAVPIYLLMLGRGDASILSGLADRYIPLLADLGSSVKSD